MSKRSNQNGYIDVEVIIGGLVAVVFIGLIIAMNVVTANWVHTTNSYASCKVTGKESVAKDKSHEYRVYTENCGVFQVSDEAWLGKFNSADTYGRIQPGTTYSIKTVGWRNGLFSTFPNIVEAGQ